MIIRQQILNDASTPITLNDKSIGTGQLVLVFGPTDKLQQPALLSGIRAAFAPDAHIVGCSTAGEITREGSLLDGVTLTSLMFSKTTLKVEYIPVATMDESNSAGKRLGRALRGEGLRFVFVLSDGLHVNGSDVVAGLRAELGDNTVISGGLAGDGTRFAKTVVVVGAEAREKGLVAVGFYGEAFSARSYSASGWEPFGAFRKVTRSRGSVVHEIDGIRALDFYCNYLGEDAAQLPASGLLYPLALRVAEKDAGLIRTLLAVDKDKGTLTFAGDVPEGAMIRLMHANHTQLIEGAGRAGGQAMPSEGLVAEFGLLISCVGRKLVMGSQADLEIEAVAEQLPHCPILAGFYSYGEIGFYEGSGTCELHNQTMTVTTLAEKAD
jgi:hypothetical protein